jgi:hypothetical protein
MQHKTAKIKGIRQVITMTIKARMISNKKNNTGPPSILCVIEKGNTTKDERSLANT